MVKNLGRTVYCVHSEKNEIFSDGSESGVSGGKLFWCRRTYYFFLTKNVNHWQVQHTDYLKLCLNIKTVLKYYLEFYDMSEEYKQQFAFEGVNAKSALVAFLA